MKNTTPDLPPIGRVFNGANIPPELKALRRWAVWKAIWNPEREKYDKVPYDGNHRGLSTKLVESWGDYDSAAMTLRLNPTRYHGLGLVLTGITDVVGIDLDNCREGTTIAPWAREIVESMGSYTEISPSGTGLRILAHGSTEDDWNNHDVGIEVYGGHTARFLTITGDTSKPRPMTAANPEVVAGLFAQHGRTRKQNPIIQITMPELIHELALPDVTEMDIPEATKEFLLHGPGEDVLDRSGALHAVGVQLYSAGYSDAEVLSIFAASQPVMDIALSHRRQDPDRESQAQGHHPRGDPRRLRRPVRRPGGGSPDKKVPRGQGPARGAVQAGDGSRVRCAPPRLVDHQGAGAHGHTGCDIWRLWLGQVLLCA